MKKSAVTSIVLIFLVALSACNLPVSVGPTGGQASQSPITGSEAATAVEQTRLAVVIASTLTAMVPEPSDTPQSSDTPQATLTPSDTPSPTLTLTPSLTPSLTLTFTSTKAMVSVSLDTNCRTGPGKEYDMVGALNTGETAEVVGREASGQYWIIKNPDNPGNCWLWGYYATVVGDTSTLPVITPPPTPTPAPGFTVAYLGIDVCAPNYAFNFQINNTGSITWESIKIVITDATTSTTFTHTHDSFKTFSGCAVGGEQADLMNGEGAVVTAAAPGDMPYNPAGHSITATITLYSHNGLSGVHSSKTLSFTG